MRDNRALARHQVQIDGKIVSPDISCCVECVVKDISEGGALVSTRGNAPAVPDRVYLWQSQTGTIFECEVRWRKRNLLGLKFIDVCGRAKGRAVIELSSAKSPARTAA